MIGLISKRPFRTVSTKSCLCSEEVGNA
jgi:hypothetical protein